MGENISDLDSYLLENDFQKNEIIEKSISVVKPGGCFLGDELVHCALEESACNGYKYYSHRELLSDNNKAAAGNHCLQTEENNVGMCTSPIDKMSCTSHPSNCIIDTKFVHRVPYCSIKYNHFPDRQSPHACYGRCTPNSNNDKDENGTCVWSVDSCPYGVGKDTNTFTRVALDHDHDSACTCDKVKIGACVHDLTAFTHCAVSPDACDSESDFVSWQELQQKHYPGGINLECRMCDPFDLQSDVPIKVGNQYTNGNNDRFNYISTKDVSCGKTGTEASTMFITGAFVGGSIMFVGTTLLYLTFGMLRRRKFNQKRNEELKGGEAEPPETL